MYKLRIPLPKQTEKIHKDKNKYDRKMSKTELKEWLDKYDEYRKNTQLYA
jgi:uncharacterized protein YecE (DUF72 family)